MVLTVQSTEADHDSKLSVAFQDLAELSNQVRQLNEKLTDNEAVYFEDKKLPSMQLTSARCGQGLFAYYLVS